MTQLKHPNDVLFESEKPFPILRSCEHYAGTPKLIKKAFALQVEYGPVFDVTCDLEDGAPEGKETEHAEIVTELLNSDDNQLGLAGLRIHDYGHPHWKKDVDIVVGGAAKLVNYVTIPKTSELSQLGEMIEYIQSTARANGRETEVPIHVLIETHFGLRNVWDIAALPHMQVLDFGMMDFISSHHGAIPAKYMRSPGQFEHELLKRAKCEIVSAALANGVVPAHNVTLDVKDRHAAYQDASKARCHFGFMRMWSIHPIQIHPIIEAMTPNHDEVNEASEILIQAQQNDWGPIRYKDSLQDRASYRYYWELLQKAHLGGVPVPKGAAAAFFAS